MAVHDYDTRMVALEHDYQRLVAERDAIERKIEALTRRAAELQRDHFGYLPHAQQPQPQIQFINF